MKVSNRRRGGYWHENCEDSWNKCGKARSGQLGEGGLELELRVLGQSIARPETLDGGVDP